MKIDKPPVTENKELDAWLEKLWLKIHEEHLFGTKTLDPPSIGAGASSSTEVTVTGAVMGDHAIASSSIDVTDLVVSAQVTAADTVTVVLSNVSASPVNIGSTTINVRVFRKIQ